MVGFAIGAIIATNFLGIIIAATLLSIVALTTKGRSKPAMAAFWSVVAVISGLAIGFSVQANWLAFDKLYVANFAGVLGFGPAVDLTSAFVITSFLVVLAMIVLLVIAVFNFLTTIGTDHTGLTQ